MLIDSLEKGVLNTDFAYRTDSFFFGWDGMKRDMDFCGSYFLNITKIVSKLTCPSMLTYLAK